LVIGLLSLTELGAIIVDSVSTIHAMLVPHCPELALEDLSTSVQLRSSLIELLAVREYQLNVSSEEFLAIIVGISANFVHDCTDVHGFSYYTAVLFVDLLSDVLSDWL
jgi:hypothetical protein